jgi:hypothetical protein
MTAGALVVAFVPLVPVVALAGFVVSAGLNLSWLGVQHRSLTLWPGQAGATRAVVGTLEVAGLAVPAAIGAVADRAGLVAAVASYAFLGLVLVALARSTGGSGLPDIAG